MCLSADKILFDLNRDRNGGKDEEGEEDPGGRSILRLGGIAFSDDRPDPAAAARGGEAVAADSDFPRSNQAPEPEESDGGGRSLLGLDRIVQSSEWKDAVARHAPPRLAPLVPRLAPVSKGRVSRRDEDEVHDGALFDQERGEFALRSRAVPAAAAATAVAPAPVAARAAAPRNPILARDLLFLREPHDPAEIEPPQFERELQPGTVTPIPVERAILLSLVAHVVLLLLLLWMPPASPSRRGLLGQLYPEPKPEDKIPIVFRSSAGPERENPKRSALSDKSRRAGGGDRSRPKSDTPFVPRNRGVEGLAPGQARSARAAPPPPPAESQPAEKTASGAAGEQFKPAPDGFRVPPPGSAENPAPNAANFQEAIRDAARQVGSRGQGGAGFPNPDGGFVDTGGLSFESTWYEWGDYWDIFVRRVKLHWKVPLDLMMLGAKGKVTITMAIMADGRLADMKVVRPSPTIPFNFSAEQALETSSPFRPLPKELLAQVPGKDRERVTVTFFYNLRPGHENDADEPPKPNPH